MNFLPFLGNPAFLKLIKSDPLKRSRAVMVATKFYLAPEKEEEKPAPKQAAPKKKKASK